jgi:hypothetical protein
MAGPRPPGWCAALAGVGPIERLDGARERRVKLELLSLATCVRLDLGMQARVTLARGEREFVQLDRDGRARCGPFRPDGVAPLATTFRRVGAEGWVA